MYLLCRSVYIGRASSIMKLPRWTVLGFVTDTDNSRQCFSRTSKTFRDNSAYRYYYNYSCFTALSLKNSCYHSYRLQRVLPVNISSISGRKFGQSYSTNVGINRHQSDIDNPSKLVKDVILFKYEDPRFFKFLNAFALFQFVFWVYMMQFIHTCLKDTSNSGSADKKEIIEDKSQPFWKMINLGSKKFKFGLITICFAVGYITLSCSWVYTLKAVRYLILHKGGKKVSFVTYTPFGKNRIMTVPLEHVSSQSSRMSSSAQLAIKVKGYWFHYVLNLKDGEFTRPALFDKTAGIKRVLK